MKWNVCLSYACSAIGLIAMVLSTTLKHKKSILVSQSVSHASGVAACLLLSGYSGAVMEGINLSRNITVVLCKKVNLFLQILFVLLSLVLGSVSTFADGFVWYGVLPVVATAAFSAIIVSPRATERSIKAGTVLSTTLWAIYTAFLGNWIYVSTNVLTACSALLFLLRNRKEKEAA